MMRRARISVRPNVRSVGRGPSSSQDGQSMLASTVNSMAAGETNQTTEMVSNPTNNEAAPEESVKKLPKVSGLTSTHNTLTEKALYDLGANGDCTPAGTSVEGRESVSGLCNIAQPRVTPRHLSTKVSESSVSKAVTKAPSSVASVSVPEVPTVIEDEGLKSSGQQRLPVRGKRPRKAEKPGLASTGVCVPSPEDLAVSVRKELETQPSTSSVVHEASSITSYQERIIKSRKLKKLMKEELKKERVTKKYKPHLEYISPLDRSKMTMRDVIYYLPEDNPMKSHMFDEHAEKERPPLLSNTIVEKPQKEVEQGEDDHDGDLSQEDEELMVPKVKVAEDGSLILDEDSLTVKVSRTTGPTIVEDNDPLLERGSTTTYSSFRKIRYVKPWSIQETDMFFLAISMVGTDFSLISQLFPHRPRKEIKNKFRKEEKVNSWRIDKAFREKRPYDQEFFSMLLERILAKEKRKRNANTQGSKAKKVNTRESKAKKEKRKTQKEVRETAQQDDSHITIEEEELDCRVPECNTEVTGKENEDSINFGKDGNKMLPNNKKGKRRNTEELADTSSAKPVGEKKRKMKTSVQVMIFDEVADAQTPTLEPESTMEHPALADRSNGATTMLSPSSRWTSQNPAASVGKRGTKRTCCTEDESQVYNVCVSTGKSEAASSEAGEMITHEKDFEHELERMDCQLNRSGCLSHEDLFKSSSAIQHGPREASTLTSISAEKCCQEREDGASRSPDVVKMDTVNVQDVLPEIGEKDSSGQNWTQGEIPRGAESMDLSLEKRNQSPSLTQVAPFQQSCAVQSSDVSPTITNADANISLHILFEGRDDLENSFNNNQKEQQVDNQNLAHEETCPRDSSDGMTNPKKAQSGPMGRRRCQQPKPNLSRVSRGPSVISVKSNEGMKEVKDAIEEQHEDLNAVTFVENSSSIQHGPREASTLTSITAEKSSQEKEDGASRCMDIVNDEQAARYVQGVPPENSEKDSSGQNWTQDEISSPRDSSDGKTSPKKAQSGPMGRRRCQQPKPNLSRVSRGPSVISVKSNEGMKEVKDAIEEQHEDLNAVRSVENRACHPSRSPSIRENIPEAVMEEDMQPVQAISSPVMTEALSHLLPKGDSCGDITTVTMVQEGARVTTDVTEQEPTFILTLFPVSELPPSPESTGEQPELLLPASLSSSSIQESETGIESDNCEGLWFNYNPLNERDSIHQVFNPSSSSVTDTKDCPEDHFGAELHVSIETCLEGAASKKAPNAAKCRKSFAATSKRGAEQISKTSMPESTKKDQAMLNEDTEQLDVLPSSPETVQPISVKGPTEEAVSLFAEAEMSQDAVYLLDLSLMNKRIGTTENTPAFESEEGELKSTPLITPLFWNGLELRENDDDTKTKRKMPLDHPFASHSSGSEINAAYSPSSPTKVYSSISQPAQCEFLSTSVKDIDEEPTDVSEYFLSDIFTEVKESESA